MNDPRDRLAALLADVLSGGGPGPELLARYAADPSALSVEERQRVERSLAEAPAVRDQLEVLKRFDVPEAREGSGREATALLADALVWIRRLGPPPLLAWTAAIGVVALVGVAGAVVGRWAMSTPEPQHLRISTGTEGGTYVTVGRRLAELIPAYSGSDIGAVEALPSEGTVENCRRLASSKADLALATGAVLALINDPCVARTRALMVLYPNRVQVVVRREASIERLRDLRGKRIFVGADGSGTRVIATKILATVELDDSDGGYDRADPATVTSFRDASSMLRDDELDAAFFVSSIPAAAVWDALGDSCCTLLDLPAASLEEAVPGLIRQQIPARSYPNQPNAKTTVGANALLIGRADLRDEVVEEILSSLADHLDGLSVANVRIQGARNATTFDERSLGGIALHPGAEKFRAGRLFGEPPTSQQ